MFTAIALLGYVFGIISKFVDSSLSYTVVFYFINGLMVATDLVLTLRNMRLDAQRDALEGKA
ncbi:MAG: hypothetical protein Q4E22_06105 [Coriobacteriia bacterium]|nr:hypothetical protein [Coriobacteriia bacterium]